MSATPRKSAEDLAEDQRQISIAEFFEKNRQILGFDSSTRALITSVKEGVDNALDACEEAGHLPNTLVEISETDEGYYRVAIEDDGPGIVREQIPKIFGKLLYGSRFHANRQSRGQQGIGISAAVLYSQLTTGTPARIISKTGSDSDAHLYELIIDTASNEPEISRDEVYDWDRPRGTRIELLMDGRYIRVRKQSIYTYIKNTATVNPHATLTLVEPDGNRETFSRAVYDLPPEPREIEVHPLGIELGQLMKMLKETDSYKLSGFLTSEFNRLGSTNAEKICEAADLPVGRRPSKMEREEARRLLDAFEEVNLVPPPVDCLSPIGEDGIYRGLEKEYPGAELISATTRNPEVYGGSPFTVEAGIAYGGDLESEGRADLLRFANRVPLLYQRGACAIASAVERINWKTYELTHRGNNGMPEGPVVMLVHVASTNVPFTSESKVAIADIPAIKDEVENALREVARDMRRHVKRRKKLQERRKKESVVKRILPRIAEKSAEVSGGEAPSVRPVVAKIMNSVLVARETESVGGRDVTRLRVANFDSRSRDLRVSYTAPGEAESASPPPSVERRDGGFRHTWRVTVDSGGVEEVEMIGGGEGEVTVSGVEPEDVVIDG
ncbi:MAG: Type 2 DNA topoisomerase 6 subunit B [Methanonatronarchaeales archaeon]|nr:Type 2 DNA topoisomerase 6 subunit B [Methanonatronarchaeales archaeon]